jgi:DNA-directed RNA polymerase specialized sigma24 family protein
MPSRTDCTLSALAPAARSVMPGTDWCWLTDMALSQAVREAGTDWERRIIDGACRRLSRKRPNWADSDEVRQECWAALLIVKRETANRDEPYVIRAVLNRVVDQWRTDSDLGRSMLAENTAAREAGDKHPWGVVSIEAIASHAEDSDAGTAVFDLPTIDAGFERAEDLIDAARLWRTAMPLLNDREQFIIIALFAGHRRLADIADEIGLSELRVSRIVRAALRRVRLHLGVVVDPTYSLHWLSNGERGERRAASA